MTKVKLLGALLVLLLMCTCVGAVGASVPISSFDPLVGTWLGDSATFLYNYDVKLICNKDGTMLLTGSVSAMDKNIILDESRLKWRSLGGNDYLGEGYGKSLKMTLSGNTLKLTVNPVDLGVVDNAMFNIDVPVSLMRLGSNPSTGNPIGDFFDPILQGIGNFLGGLFGFFTGS